MDTKYQKYKTVVLVAVKSSKFIKFIKLLKFFKFAKPFLTIGSIFISLFAYSVTYGWSLAITAVVMMFVHELGHVFMVNKEGFKCGRMIFIPLLGAMIDAPVGMNRRQEAIIGIGGPWLGSLFAYLFVGIYFITGQHWFLAASFVGLVLNLFNMIPVSPMDGGRVTQAVGSYFSIVGFVILIILTILLKAPHLLLVWILVLTDFKWFSKKICLYAGIAIEVAMILSLTTGYGLHSKTDFWMLLIDVFLGLLFIFILGYRTTEEYAQEQKSDRPPLSLGQKISWFLVWFITTATLIATLILLAPIMHKQ